MLVFVKGLIMRVYAVGRVARVSPVSPPVLHTNQARGLGEWYTLNLASGESKDFHAKSIAAAIIIGKRMLGLAPDASAEKFRRAGGKNIVRKGTGLPVYPPKHH